MTSATTAFRPFHAWDRSFFLAFAAICWLGVIMGFAPAVGARLQGDAAYPAPLILHLHAASFVGWLFLLTSQTVLIRARRIAAHRTMGLIGVALVPVMVVSGIVAEHFSQRFHVVRDPENLRFFIIPIFYTVAFAILASAALLLRRDPATHKRLILLATTVIVGAAYARWWGEGLAAIAGDGFWGKIVETFTGTNLIVLMAMAYDQLTRGRVHAAYLVAAPALVISELLVSYVYHLDGWPAVARRLVGL